MDTIIVKSVEDMERICSWVCDSCELFANGPEFRIPFRKGEIRLPYYGCRLEFECEGETCVQFKLYPTIEALPDEPQILLDWAKSKAETDLLLAEFRLDVHTVTDTLNPLKVPLNVQISKKRLNVNAGLFSVALLKKRDELFSELATEWLALMLLAVYYRPQFESKKQVAASSVSGKKGKKAKKAKRMKTLYTRTYVIDSDLMDELPKPVKRHAKPDHEYGVRGHYRRYKSGKVAWVHPHIRCKGRNPGSGGTFVAKLADEK